MLNFYQESHVLFQQKDYTMAGSDILEIVNEDDIVVGVRPRLEIHTLGLRHREVHVWFVTPNNDIIFQRRSSTKDTFPNLLDATVGGHVEVGQTYEQAALMEIQEEAGLDVTLNEIHPLVKLKTQAIDERLNKKNLTFRQIYWLRYLGNVEDLLIEKEDGAGFTKIPASEVFRMTPNECGECIPSLFQHD
jgi:8-oxo-dGTP pyrophosphatase MutT (NUDIX family)